MPRANMLRGMLSYLQGGSAVVTQAQANEVGAWGKCWESVGINLECPRGARHATFFLQGGSVAVTQAQVNGVGVWGKCGGSVGKWRQCPRGAPLGQ